MSSIIFFFLSFSFRCSAIHSVDDQRHFCSWLWFFFNVHFIENCHQFQPIFSFHFFGILFCNFRTLSSAKIILFDLPSGKIRWAIMVCMCYLFLFLRYVSNYKVFLVFFCAFVDAFVIIAFNHRNLFEPKHFIFQWPSFIVFLFLYSTLA